MLAGAIFLGDSLSCSRPPCLDRPPGVAARWLRQPRHGVHSHGFGAYEEDGREQQPAGDRIRGETAELAPNAWRSSDRMHKQSDDY